MGDKLKECENLFPYLLLSADYTLAVKASKSLQKLAAIGSLSTKCALLDQLVYFLKELMLETPEDWLVTQFCQHLVSFVKTWHQMEKNKLAPAPGTRPHELGI